VAANATHGTHHVLDRVGAGERAPELCRPKAVDGKHFVEPFDNSGRNALISATHLEMPVMPLTGSRSAHHFCHLRGYIGKTRKTAPVAFMISEHLTKPSLNPP